MVQGNTQQTNKATKQCKEFDTNLAAGMVRKWIINNMNGSCIINKISMNIKKIFEM